MILRERGAVGLLSLSLAISACVSSPPAPAPARSPAALVSPATLARQSARVLVRISAYDYALAGSLAGERVRVVAPDRYVAALAGERDAIAAIKDRLLGSAFADAALAGALVEVADADVRVFQDLQRFADAQDDLAFARIVQDVASAWSTLRELATRLPPDEALSSSISRGTAWTVTIARAPGYAVVTAPFASREEAIAAARRVGAVEQVASASPFTIRLLTTPDRTAAERRVAELRDLAIVSAVVETERLAFVRAGPDPLPELWREPAMDIPTQGGAKRANFIAGGVMVVSVDGNAFAFDDAGQPKWRARVNAGPSFVTPASGGAFVLVGGQFAQLLTSDGRSVGAAARLPSAAAGAVWLEGPRVFVAASQGPTGKPEGGGGGVAAIGLDGKALGDPFPLVTPAAGPALAASPARGEVHIATTSQGTTDVEVIRPGIDAKPRTVARVAGEVQDLAVDDAGTYAALVTTQGTFRFRIGVADPGATIERVGLAARDVGFGRDGTLYVLFADRLVAYDAGLRQRWSVTVSNGVRVLIGRRVVVQDGLRRVRVVDSASGAQDELASLGDIDDAAVSPDGARVLLLVEGRRAVLFQLP